MVYRGLIGWAGGMTGFGITYFHFKDGAEGRPYKHAKRANNNLHVNFVPNIAEKSALLEVSFTY